METLFRNHAALPHFSRGPRAPSFVKHQPAESVASSAASLQSRSDRHRVATKRRPVIPSESGEAIDAAAPVRQTA